VVLWQELTRIHELLHAGKHRGKNGKPLFSIIFDGSSKVRHTAQCHT
jgi:hypothetical protein